MKISEAARQAGVSRDTVRHYVEIGLLKPYKNPDNGYQVFDQATLNRLRFIKTARDLGLRLPDIQLIFADAERATSPCPRVRDLMQTRLNEARARIVELTELCDRIAGAMEQWRQMPDSTPNGHSVCQLIESQLSDTVLPETETHE